MPDVQTDTQNKNELEELLNYDIKSLLSEFTKTREELKQYLRDSGIDVPEADIANMIGRGSESESPEEEESVLLDEFTEQTVSGLSKSVKSVYGLAGDFIKLFDILPDNPVLQSVSVTSEDEKKYSAKELYDMIQQGQLDKNTQLIIDGRGLVSLADEFGKTGEGDVPSDKEPEAKEGDKLQEQSDSQKKEGISDTEKETKEKQSTATKESEEQLSPLISQEEYDKLFEGETAPDITASSMKTDAVSQDNNKLEEEKKAPAPKAIAPKEIKLKVAGHPPPPSNHVNKREPSGEKGDDTSLSQDELDKLFGGGGGGDGADAKSEETQEETPATSGSEKTTDNAENLSQDELDKLFGSDDKDAKKDANTADISNDTKQTPAKNAEAEGNLSQDELDKLFG